VLGFYSHVAMPPTPASLTIDKIRTMQRKLVIHLGLPKTGTTTMQKHFFPRFVGYQGKNYQGKRYEGWPEVSSKLIDIFYESLSLQTLESEWKRQLSVLIKQLDFQTYPIQVISDEHLSWRASEGPFRSIFPPQNPVPGNTPRRTRHPITDFLITLRDFLPAEVDLLTIVTLRNQADFLGSLAAQHRILTPEAVSRVIEDQDTFIDFFTLVTDLEKVVGAPNHLTLLFEDGVENNCEKILEFMDTSLVDSAHPFKLGAAENVRAVSESVWKFQRPQRSYRNSMVFHAVRKLFPTRWREIMRPVSNRVAGVIDNINDLIVPRPMGFVSVSGEERDAIRAYCGPSNALLAQHLKRDLVSLGY